MFKTFWFFVKKNIINRAEKIFLNNTVQYALWSKFAIFSDFQKIQDFFLKNLSILFKKTQILNALKNLTISVAFYSRFATFSDF